MRQIESALARLREAGQARSDIALADVVCLIWSNGRMRDGQLYDAIAHLGKAH